MSGAQHSSPLYPQAALRPPGEVMRLARMGSFFPTRLSFMRSMIRRLSAEGAEVRRTRWEINDEGFGRAVYTVGYGGHDYSLVAFSTPLAPENRTDRVIAEAWDTTYVLYDGIPDTAELDRLQANAPKQEAGRYEATDLVLSRANKSVRLFEHVAERLAAGRQPDADMLASVGYLMRTTAVYGNGKFGIADRSLIAGRPGLEGPFQAEMLSVWLTRGFTHDLVEHVAKKRAPDTAVPLKRNLKRHLGIGNSTGLGMAPYLVNHPVLLNNWMSARETALARVRAVQHADPATVSRVRELLDRARRHIDQWQVADERQMSRVEQLRKELVEVDQLMSEDWLSQPDPWDRLVRASEQWSLECQEFIVALVLEPYGDLVDGLSDCMSSSVEPCLVPQMTMAQLGELVTGQFGWALAFDFSQRHETEQFWYVSEEKLEPRLGWRYSEPGAELEQPLDIARQVSRLNENMAGIDGETCVAEFLMRFPGHRNIVRRIQTAARFPYSEIHDNLIGGDCLAIDILRCKLSFFGASKFDPKSDRWTRINMYQGAPLFDEIAGDDVDDWWLPVSEFT